MMDRQPKLTRQLVYGGFKVASHWSAMKHRLRESLRCAVDGSLVDQPSNPKPGIEVMGLCFANRLGIAAGFDRHGSTGRHLGSLGFGHVEIGTLTRRPEPDHNLGIEILANRRGKPSATILGINVGLNRDASINDVGRDLKYCLSQAWPHADYVTINLSSPMARELLQANQQDRLLDILSGLKNQQTRLHVATGRYVPLVVKVALSSRVSHLPPIIELIKQLEFDGVILAVDSHKGANADKLNLWRQPQQQSLICQLIARVCHELDGKVAVISVGGVMNIEHVNQRVAAGAALVQIHNGLIYHGPKIVRDLSKIHQGAKDRH